MARVVKDCNKLRIKIERYIMILEHGMEWDENEYSWNKAWIKPITTSRNGWVTRMK